MKRSCLLCRHARYVEDRISKRPYRKSRGPRVPGQRRRIYCGYVAVYCPSHPRGGGAKEVLEHILIAEKALGHLLPKGAEVHHLNGDRADNRNANLVVCEDHTYHSLLHRRQIALDTCGHAGWCRCKVCGVHDSAENLHAYMEGRKTRYYHKACETARSARIRSNVL